MEKGSHFPIQNLPYGIFRKQKDEEPRVGVAIGDYVLDLAVLHESGLLKIEGEQDDSSIFRQRYLNAMMEAGSTVWKAIRKQLQQLLDEGEASLRDDMELRERAFTKIDAVELLLPVEIGDYTDFYASKEHATNVGSMFRGKDQALMPNWTHLPVGYHGRASSVVVSGTEVRRPNGQMKPPGHEFPIFGPSKQLDFELELGWFVGHGNVSGEPIRLEEAEEKIFGLVLVNDWSARDIQAWEYQPLGPFLAKSFATSISPWVVPMDALEPFRVQGPKQEPTPLSYLEHKKAAAFDIQLDVSLKGSTMESIETFISTNFKYMYWSMAQQMSHHTINGCNLRAGDLLASGTISGPEKSERGCLLERTWRGEEPITFSNGDKRVWLEDDDEVVMTGYCQGNGYRVGFGEVRAKIAPALEM